MKEKFITNNEKPKKYSYKSYPVKNKLKENQNKEYYTKSRHSSDLSSLSCTQTDAFSQNSENFNFQVNESSSQNPSYLSYHKNYFEGEHTINYFDNIIKHFIKTEPEKFLKYKNTKNFLPKRKRENIDNQCNDNNNKYSNSINQYNNEERNIPKPIYYIQVDNSIYNQIINGNIVYYICNNYFYPVFLNQQNIENNIIKSDDKIEICENKIQENEADKHNVEEKEENKEAPKINDIEIIKVKKDKNKIEDNYLFKKRNKKCQIKESSKENKDIDIEYYESNKYRKKNEFNIYDRTFAQKTFSSYHNGTYKQKGHYNKFNNFGSNAKHFFPENKFHRNKYYQHMYY